MIDIYTNKKTSYTEKYKDIWPDMNIPWLDLEPLFISEINDINKRKCDICGCIFWFTSDSTLLRKKGIKEDDHLCGSCFNTKSEDIDAWKVDYTEHSTETNMREIIFPEYEIDTEDFQVLTKHEKQKKRNKEKIKGKDKNLKLLL